MAQAAVADYAMASLQGHANRLFDTGAVFGWADADGFRLNTQTVPFGIIQTRKDPRQLWILDGFLRRVDVEGGEVWDGSMGVGWRLGYLESQEPRLRWSITPSARATVVGSRDLGAAQAIYSTALTTRMEHARENDLLFGWNLMYGYYETQSVSGEYAGDYGLANQILRTGLEASGPLRLPGFSEPATWQAHYVYTRVTGSDWYYDNFNTLGFTIGTRPRPDRELWTALRLGLECDLADGYTGCEVLLGYQF
jgi:hypothetical protein